MVLLTVALAGAMFAGGLMEVPAEVLVVVGVVVAATAGGLWHLWGVVLDLRRAVASQAADRR